MIVLGLLLILIAAGATVFAGMAPSGAAQTIQVTALGLTVSASPLAMFVAGAVSLALLVLGYLLVSRGALRQSRSRKELRQLRKEQAAAGSGTATEGGHRSTRRDRSRAGGGTTEPASNTDNTDNSDKGMSTERHADSEPPPAS